MSVCHTTSPTPPTPPGGAPGDALERAASLLTPPATTPPGWVRAVAAGGMPLGHMPQVLDREREREHTTRRGRARHAERQEEEGR